ncbi:hypothetical protein GCM10010441_46670 [Kitasatospora paracochleata]|uniref:TIR domain-containing protein n=1 Tax=Kitasatospora paracochleata TaxID=58354 RepID=A0ABT1J660_9ACTN|nr:hypothetical protein [Kitasatospora paracochleata]MCP2312917.1 hypothetical protein [Kitasatospora paracochleata]
MPTTESPKSAFIIMPFRDELDWLHYEIVSACSAEGVTARRGDDVFSPGAILGQILEDIDSSDVIFAVCTGKNANVFFELGYAWQRHEPILIAEDTHDLPFDISAFRVAMYGQDAPAGSKETLKWRLRQAIKAVLSKERPGRGRVLNEPPQRKSVARLTASLQGYGRSHRLVITNSGTVEVLNVSVAAPPEASSFSLLTEDLPIEVLRPGESVKILASISMGGGKSIFDVEVTGNLADGSPVSFPAKISI